MRSLTVNKAFKEYSEIEKNDRNVFEFYKKYKETFSNIESLSDPDEITFFCFVNFDFAIALIKRKSYENAIEILLRVKEYVDKSELKDLKSKFKYIDYHIALCYFSLSNYKLASKFISNFGNIDKEDEPEIHNLKESISVYITKKIESIVLIVATALIIISSFFLSEPFSIYVKTIFLLTILSSYILFYFKYTKFNSISTLYYLKNSSSSIYLYTILFIIFISFSFWPHKFYLSSGNFLKAYGLYDNAIEMYSKSIIKNPEHSSAYNSRGVIFLYENKLNESVDDFNKAISLSESPTYYKNRALSFFLLGRQGQGINDINTAKNITHDSDFNNTCQYLKDGCNFENKNACTSLELLKEEKICN